MKDIFLTLLQHIMNLNYYSHWMYPIFTKYAYLDKELSLDEKDSTITPILRNKVSKRKKNMNSK